MDPWRVGHWHQSPIGQSLSDVNASNPHGAFEISDCSRQPQSSGPASCRDMSCLGRAGKQLSSRLIEIANLIERLPLDPSVQLRVANDVS